MKSNEMAFKQICMDIVRQEVRNKRNKKKKIKAFKNVCYRYVTMQINKYV